METFIDSLSDLSIRFFKELVYKVNSIKKCKIHKLFIKEISKLPLKGKFPNFFNEKFLNFVPSFLRNMSVFMVNGTSTTTNSHLSILLGLVDSIVEELNTRISDNVRNWTSFLQDVERFVNMGGTYTIGPAYTTFDGGTNSELQRMASSLHNELARLVRATNRLAWLLGYLRDLERLISDRSASYVGRYNNFRIEDIYPLSDTRFYDAGRWLNRYLNFNITSIRLALNNDGRLVPSIRVDFRPYVVYLLSLDDLSNIWENIG